MRKRSGFLLIVGLLVLVILTCSQTRLTLPTATVAPTKPEKTATDKPSCIATDTQAATIIPFATSTHMPTPTSASRAPDASHYLLASYTAGEMDDYINWLELKVLSILNDSYERGMTRHHSIDPYGMPLGMRSFVSLMIKGLTNGVGNWLSIWHYLEMG